MKKTPRRKQVKHGRFPCRLIRSAAVFLCALVLLNTLFPAANVLAASAEEIEADSPAHNPNKALIDSAGKDIPTTDSRGEPLDDETIRSEIYQARQEAAMTIPIDTNAIPGWPQGPAVSSPAAIVMDIDTGVILYGKDIDATYYPASITKVMTALLACENASPDDKVVFSDDAIYTNFEPGSASFGMNVGETITMEQALCCLLVGSANEVANGIAETVGGSNEGFAQMMNEKAASLGCTHSHFTNPHGLHNDLHYVSARDMALIAAAAYKNPWYRRICGLERYHRPATEFTDDTWEKVNNHQMFRSTTDFYYEGCTGGKTGGTNEAHTTLVTFAERDGMRIVCVVLYSDGLAVYTNTTALFDYAFANFRSVSIKENEKDPDIIRVDPSARVTLPNGLSFSDLEYDLTLDRLTKKQYITYRHDGMTLGEANVGVTRACYKRLGGYGDETNAEEISGEASDEETGSGTTEKDAGKPAVKRRSRSAVLLATIKKRVRDIITSQTPYVFAAIAAAALVIVYVIVSVSLRIGRKRKKNYRIGNPSGKKKEDS